MEIRIALNNTFGTRAGDISDDLIPGFLADLHVDILDGIGPLMPNRNANVITDVSGDRHKFPGVITGWFVEANPDTLQPQLVIQIKMPDGAVLE